MQANSKTDETGYTGTRNNLYKKGIMYASTLIREIKWSLVDKVFRPQVPAHNFEISEDLKKNWNENGWIVLKGVYSPAEVDEINREVSEFRKFFDDGGRDEYGRGLRVGFLHAVNRKILKFLLNPKTKNFLRWAIQDEPALFGSLTFDIGTEQEAHIDAAFFNTSPDHAMAATWVALEDIHMDSGPLFYVNASHKFDKLTANDVFAEDADLKSRVHEFRKTGRPAIKEKKLSNEVYIKHSKLLQRRLEELGAEKRPVTLKKGDVFVWHGWLVHGGSARLNRELTRKSMVAHFIGRNCTYWDQDDFFLNGDRLNEIQPVQFNFRTCSDGIYVRRYGAVTFKSGNGHFKA